MTEDQKKALKELLTNALGNIGRISLKDAVARMRKVRGFFTEEGYARATQAYEERVVSSVLRSIESEDGKQVYHNIISDDEEGGNHVYVQLPLLNLEDYKQVGEYRLKMILRHMKVLKDLALECKSQHHTKLPIQLPLIEKELESLRPLLSGARRSKRAELPEKGRRKERTEESRLVNR
jgi:hypothetical protein